VTYNTSNPAEAIFYLAPFDIIISGYFRGDRMEQSVQKQIELIRRNTVELIPEEELVKKVEKAIKPTLLSK